MEVKMRDELNEKKLPAMGTSREYAMKILAAKRPDLRDAVINGEMSANAAMVVAGLRKAQVSVPLDGETIEALNDWASKKDTTRTKLLQLIIKDAIAGQLNNN